MGYFSSEIVARTRFEEKREEIDGEALKLGRAIGTSAMTRVRRAVFQEQSSQGLTSVVVRQAAQT